MTIQRAFIAALKSRTFGLALGDIYSGSSFSASAGFTIYRNGSTPWTVPTTAGIGDSYEVQVAQNSGITLTTAPVGWTSASWHALTSDRTWELFNDVDGTTLSANVTITIRVAGGGATVATETLNIDVEVYP